MTLSEWVFPLVGAAVVMLVVLPLAALATKCLLLAVEHKGMGGALRSLQLRYLLLTGSSLLPLAWFLSAGLHQAESGRSSLGCLFEHNAGGFCMEPGLFALVLCLVVLACSLRPVRRLSRPVTSRSPRALALSQRVHRLIDGHPRLGIVRGRLCPTEHRGLSIATYGFSRPYIVLGIEFADSLSDEMLASALGHEAEHVATQDPLRFLLLQIALSLNPLGRVFLAPHAERWYAAREAHCDREAVLQGAAPLSLAAAMVRAARPSSMGIAALGARDTTVLRFRIAMLLAFAERPPIRRAAAGRSAFPAALLLILAAVVLPHQAGTAALGALHSGAERALFFVWN